MYSDGQTALEIAVARKAVEVRRTRSNSAAMAVATPCAQAATLLRLTRRCNPKPRAPTG